MSKTMVGDNYLDVLMRLNNLALFYSFQGCFGELEPLDMEGSGVSNPLMGGLESIKEIGDDFSADNYVQQV